MPHKDPIHILTVEDSDEDYALLKRLLAKGLAHQPHTLLRATTVKEAIRMIATDPVSLILLDLGLPEANFGASFQLISASVEGRVPIIVQTATEEPEWIERIMSSGAQDYLIKHEITPEVLRKSIMFSIERHNYRTELRRLNASLKSSDPAEKQNRDGELLRQLATGLVHQLKNPLGTLMFGIHFLQDVEFEDETAKEVLHRMLRSVGRADRIVSDLLDFAAEADFNASTMDLSELLESAIEVVSCRLDSPSGTIQLERELPGEEVLISCDRRKLEHSLINLLENSIDALQGQSDGRITTRVELEDDQGILITVEDNGPGIPEALQGLVVTPFYTTKSGNGGTGLGLSVVDRVAKLHGGSFAVSSENGSTLARIFLPSLIRK